MSKRCAGCSNEITEATRFCPECGQRQLSQCSCGYAISGTEKFCPNCGTQTDHSRSVASDSAASGSRVSDFKNPSFTITDSKNHSHEYQPELAPGTELLHYRIEKLLGRGALSTVYKVQNTQLDETLALKVVASFEKKHPLIEAYRDEYKAQRAIVDKSHILHCEAPQFHRHTDDMTYLMLPIELAHESLKDWMQRHPANNELRLKRGLELFKQACMGVEAIHKQGLVHLDLKPGNILLTGDPENQVVKIADFGLSRSMQKAGQRQAQYRDGIGTPAYMAPEQIKSAHWKDIGSEADIYALGMILYELLDSDLPYSGSAQDICEKKRDATITIRPPKSSPYLAEVAMACLNRDKEKRPGSAIELMTLVDTKRAQELQEQKRTEEQRRREEQVRRQVNDLLEQAKRAYTSGKLEHALELLDEALALDPTNQQAIDAKKVIAKEFKEQKEEQQKLKLLRKIVNDIRHHKLNLQQRVQNLLKQAKHDHRFGRLGEAYKLLDEVLDLDPTNREAIDTKNKVIDDLKKQLNEQDQLSILEDEKERERVNKLEERRLREEKEKNKSNISQAKSLFETAKFWRSIGELEKASTYLDQANSLDFDDLSLKLQLLKESSTVSSELFKLNINKIKTLPNISAFTLTDTNIIRNPVEELSQGLKRYKEKNYSKAYHHFEFAAEKGNPDAQYYLGKGYIEGEGLKQDIQKGYNWMLKSAKQGDVDAQVYLISFFGEGVHTDPDYEEALRWAKIAVNNGSTVACNAIGLFYERGLGVPKNYSEAKKWYQKAANEGNHYAKDKLKEMSTFNYHLENFWDTLGNDLKKLFGN